MEDREFTQILNGWAAISLRQAVHDFNRFTRRSGLSFIQMSVLLHLLDHGPSEIMEFASELHLSSSGASQLVDRMTQQGLVTREDHPSDRRVRMVYLTERGCEVAQESIAARGIWLDGLVKNLTEQEKDRVGEVLSFLTDKAKEG